MVCVRQPRIRVGSARSDWNGHCCDSEQQLTTEVFMHVKKLLIGALFGIMLLGSAEIASAQRSYRGDWRSTQQWDGDRYSRSGWDSGRRSRSRRYWRNSRWGNRPSWSFSNRRYRRQQYWNYVRWRRQQYWNNRRASRRRALRYGYYRNY